MSGFSSRCNTVKCIRTHFCSDENIIRMRKSQQMARFVFRKFFVAPAKNFSPELSFKNAPRPHSRQNSSLPAFSLLTGADPPSVRLAGHRTVTDDSQDHRSVSYGIGYCVLPIVRSGQGLPHCIRSCLPEK